MVDNNFVKQFPTMHNKKMMDTIFLQSNKSILEMIFVEKSLFKSPFKVVTSWLWKENKNMPF